MDRILNNLRAIQPLVNKNIYKDIYENVLKLEINRLKEELDELLLLDLIIKRRIVLLQKTFHVL